MTVSGALRGEELPLLAPIALGALALLSGLSSGYLSGEMLERRAATALPPPERPTPQPVVVNESPVEVIKPEPKKMVCPAGFWVHFARGSSRPPKRLEPSEERAIAELGAWLKAHPTHRVLVEGHTDATGDPNANLILSHKRARSVAKRLGRAGLSKDLLTVRAFGAYQPLAEGRDAQDANRRVRVRVFGPHCAERSL